MPVAVKEVAAIYVRVSTTLQELRGTSLETQIEILRQLARDDGRVVPDEYIYSDTVSGESTLRDGFERMMGGIGRGLFNRVYILDPDRLGRGAFEVMSLCNRLQEAGAFVVFKNGPSGDSEESKLLMMILGWAAGQERLKIAERTMRGKAQVARSGRLPIGVGRNGIFGYHYDPETKIRTIIEAEAIWVVQMYEWYASGWTSYAIACELNERGVLTKTGKLWHPRTVENILRNESYMGWDVFGKYRCRTYYVNRGTPDEKKVRERTLRPESEWIWIEGFSPVIVDPTLWKQVQRRLDMPRAKNMGPEVYVLTGHSWCSTCGTKINGASRSKGVRKYRCRGTQKASTRAKICSAEYIEADEFEASVFGGLATALRNPELVLAELDEFLITGEGDIAVQISEMKKRVRECQEKEDRFLALYGDAEIDQDALKRQTGPVKAFREECERTLGELERQREWSRDAERTRALVAERCHELAEGIEDLDFAGKQALLGALDVQVLAVRGEVSMTITVTGKRTTTGRTLA